MDGPQFEKCSWSPLICWLQSSVYFLCLVLVSSESPTREGLSKAIRDYYFKNKKVTEKDEKKQENVDKDVAGADQKEGETNTESTNQINKVANQTR